MALIMAAACALNNVLDRKIDAKMDRTKGRALVAGAIRPSQALFFASVLAIVGFVVLGWLTNWLVFWLGAVAIFSYVVLYGIGKRQTVHGTLIGAVPGALPPIAGYASVTNHLDIGALLLFFILVCWQMPHFYAIAMYRFEDYKNASLPVVTVRYGMRAAKVQILIYVILFAVATTLLSVFNITGYSFLVIMLVASGFWFIRVLRTWDDPASQWGRRMFIDSLKVNMVMALALAVGSWLP